MSSKYTARQLLEMAVKKIGVDPNADMDGDNRVSPADARIALREELGLEKKPSDNAAYEYKPDETLTGFRQELLDGLMNAPAADFDINADKLYNQYRDMYTKNASLAAENAYGLASAYTGGYGNSYAASAASAAYDRYMEGLTDRALEIGQARNAREQAARDDVYKRLNTVNALESADYARHRDRLSLAFDAAKQGDYSQLEELGVNTAGLRRGDITALAQLAASYGDLSFLRAMGVDTDALTDDAALQKALAAADYGDYSYLNALGVDTAGLQYNALLKTAAALSEYGDYSALEALGVDVSALKENALFERALALAKYGDYSLLGSFSENLKNLKQKVSVTVQKGAEEAYAYGGYGSLVKYLDKQVGYGQINEDAKKQILRVVTGG
mgnify:CR=1 FL=1